MYRVITKTYCDGAKGPQVGRSDHNDRGQPENVTERSVGNREKQNEQARERDREKEGAIIRKW